MRRYAHSPPELAEPWAWGSNYFGQLGDGGTTTSAARPVPVHVPAGVTFVRIAAGAQHSLAVDSSGRVWAWGWNDVGQLGDGTTMNRSVPVLTKLPPTVKIRSVAAEAYESFAVDRRGHVWQWGTARRLPRAYGGGQ